MQASSIFSPPGHIIVRCTSEKSSFCSINDHLKKTHSYLKNQDIVPAPSNRSAIIIPVPFGSVLTSSGIPTTVVVQLLRRWNAIRNGIGQSFGSTFSGMEAAVHPQGNEGLERSRFLFGCNKMGDFEV